ncbi:hypothetical protein ACIBG4_40955 [Nonomuraea sp. NPDC050383]|uniref:hypothetical protein n=1 Tax=Nonomuraea sp. NPDC050383 TaxID=3364362 RepID=UPI00378FB703
MSGLPDWELREAPDPPFDIVAHWEGDKLIITVAASLQGLAREDAIDGLLRRHRRRTWKAVWPIPALIGAWEWTNRKVRAHERVASAAAGTAATVIVGAAALTVTGALDSDERRTPYAGPPPTIITMTVHPTRSELSSTARPATPRPTRRQAPPPDVVETRRPAGTPPPAVARSRRAAAEPTRRPRRSAPASARPTRDRPEPLASATVRQPRRERETAIAVTAPPSRTERPTVDARPATTAPAPQPGPTVAAAGCGGIIHARVDPLLDVCVRLR